MSMSKDVRFNRILELPRLLGFSCIMPSVCLCLVCLHDGDGKKERNFLLSFIKGFFFFLNLVSEFGFPGTSSSNYLAVFVDLSVNSDFVFGFNANSASNF